VTALLREHVLHEAQLAAGLQDALHLRQDHGHVPHRAQHQRRHHRVERAVRRRQPFGRAVDYRDRQPGLPGLLLGELAQVPLGLDGQHAGHRLGIVAEVQPVARTDLEDRAGEARQEPRPVVGDPRRFHAGRRPDVEAGE